MIQGSFSFHELQSTEEFQDMRRVAHMLVDMLNTEAMTSAWVSYSNLTDNIHHLPSAYKEAKTALEVGKIFLCPEKCFWL